MKPSDVFVGVIDFFSTLVPGAIATFFLITTSWFHPPAHWPYIERGSIEGWVVFLVSAYVLGHLIAAVGSSLLDPLYDRVYVRWRRASSEYVKSRLFPNPPRLAVILERVEHVIKKSNPDDELLATAKMLKRQQLAETSLNANVKADKITNTFMWAGTVVRLKASAGAAEVDALSAQSKLFRSVTVLLPFAVFWAGLFQLSAILGWIAILLLCLWRFLYLRWSATERTYEYFIATSLLGAEPKRESPPHDKGE